MCDLCYTNEAVIRPIIGYVMIYDLTCPIYERRVYMNNGGGMGFFGVVGAILVALIIFFVIG